MPLVAHHPLPSFERLRAAGEVVLDHGRASIQDIRELHIGILNMMPDAAFRATELQFLRLLGQSNDIAQIFAYPFTLPEITRGADTEAYIDAHYFSFETLQTLGLDGLIITGANLEGEVLADMPFYAPLKEVVDWAYDAVTSTLCSCIATHAVMHMRYGEARRKLITKRAGVFAHTLGDTQHPLTRNINTRFDVPHSRHNEITKAQFARHGLPVLAASADAGVHLATSADGIRFVFFQGHPEYSTNSLLKEYKRDILAGLPTAYPANYFNHTATAILAEHAYRIAQGEALAFPEAILEGLLHNSWRDTARAIVSNWVGLMYQITGFDRHAPFMDGIDPNSPLPGYARPHAKANETP